MRLIQRVLAAAALLLSCSPPAAARQAGLPPSWDGVWKGATTLNWASGKAEEAAMALHVSPVAGETLHSRFTINGNLVTTRFEPRGDRVDVELTMFDASKPRAPRLTGGNFEAASFSPKYVQRGTLRRAPPARKDKK